ncbi:MAG: chemotaxis protein CheW [Deltaproteobacteria bacterium]|jgi:purine-binding chemotaxis protein CheW|nr:chemotaxis protein CheW [Deltaproteobacteria bacterium]
MSQAEATESSSLAVDHSKDMKFLRFELDGEYYGLDILKIMEINGMMDITAVPQTPLFMKGLINLRGKVIPVIDLRLKFGLPEQAYTERTSIIVIEFRTVAGTTQMGIVVDRVSEVITINQADIDPAPEFGTRLRSEYIKGMAKTKTQVLIILDIDLILTDEELTFGPRSQPAPDEPQEAGDGQS